MIRWQQHAQVLVIGDSMAEFSADELRAAGDSAGYEISIDAQIGIPLAARLDTIRSAVQSGPRRLVVELGTNDVVLNTPVAMIDALIDHAVAAVQSVSCAVFVNVGLLDGHVQLADHFNEHLHAALGLARNEHEYDWSADLHQHPEWAADNAHLQTPYWPFYAHGIVDAVKRFCD